MLAVLLSDLAGRVDLDRSGANLLVQALGNVVVLDVINDFLALFFNLNGVLALVRLLQCALGAETLALQVLFFVRSRSGQSDEGHGRNSRQRNNDLFHR